MITWPVLVEGGGESKKGPWDRKTPSKNPARVQKKREKRKATNYSCDNTEKKGQPKNPKRGGKTAKNNCEKKKKNAVQKKGGKSTSKGWSWGWFVGKLPAKVSKREGSGGVRVGPQNSRHNERRKKKKKWERVFEKNNIRREGSSPQQWCKKGERGGSNFHGGAKQEDFGESRELGGICACEKTKTDEGQERRRGPRLKKRELCKKSK